MTECAQSQFPLEAHLSRRVVSQLGGGQLPTEGGLVAALHSTRVGRFDEVGAARKPILRWKT